MSRGARRAASEYGVVLGDEAVTVSTAAVGLTVPAGALQALVTNGASAIRVRWGTPTSTVGHYLNPRSAMEIFNSMDDLQFIRAGAVDSTIHVTYFG